jgi:hypothetical protein
MWFHISTVRDSFIAKSKVSGTFTAGKDEKHQTADDPDERKKPGSNDVNLV